MRLPDLIALTASAMRGDRERFLEAGCDDYLSKPFMTAELIELVQKHYDSLVEQDPLHVPQMTQVDIKPKLNTSEEEPTKKSTLEKEIEGPKPVEPVKEKPAPKASRKIQAAKQTTLKPLNKKKKKILEASILQNINPEFINPPTPNADTADKSNDE